MQSKSLLQNISNLGKNCGIFGIINDFLPSDDKNAISKCSKFFYQASEIHFQINQNKNNLEKIQKLKEKLEELAHLLADLPPEINQDDPLKRVLTFPSHAEITGIDELKIENVNDEEESIFKIRQIQKRIEKPFCVLLKRLKIVDFLTETNAHDILLIKSSVAVFDVYYSFKQIQRGWGDIDCVTKKLANSYDFELSKSILPLLDNLKRTLSKRFYQLSIEATPSNFSHVRDQLTRLIEMGADINFCETIPDTSRIFTSSPLIVAVNSSNIEAIQFYLAQNAKITISVLWSLERWPHPISVEIFKLIFAKATEKQKLRLCHLYLNRGSNIKLMESVFGQPYIQNYIDHHINSIYFIQVGDLELILTYQISQKTFDYLILDSIRSLNAETFKLLLIYGINNNLIFPKDVLTERLQRSKNHFKCREENQCGLFSKSFSTKEKSYHLIKKLLQNPWSVFSNATGGFKRICNSV